MKDIKYFALTNYSLVWRLLLRQMMKNEIIDQLWSSPKYKIISSTKKILTRHYIIKNMTVQENVFF